MMRATCCFSLLVFLLIPCLATAGTKTTREYAYRPFELSLWPPVNVFHVDNKVVIGLGINLLYGRTSSTYGLEVGTVANRELENFGGVQVAGFGNIVKKDVYGLQVAGLWNSAGRLHGIQAGVFANVAWEGGGGLQVSPLCNFTDGGKFWLVQLAAYNQGSMMKGKSILRGIQIGYLGNWIGAGEFSGLQVGTGGNVVKGPASGVQISGFGNLVTRSFTGIQLGMANIANQKSYLTGRNVGPNLVESVTVFYREPMTGLQLGVGNIASIVRGAQLGGGNIAIYQVTGLQAGIFNWAETVHGVQLGVLNICKQLRGIQIGALNIATRNALPFMVGVNAGW